MSPYLLLEPLQISSVFLALSKLHKNYSFCLFQSIISSKCPESKFSEFYPLVLSKILCSINHYFLRFLLYLLFWLRLWLLLWLRSEHIQSYCRWWDWTDLDRRNNFLLLLFRLNRFLSKFWLWFWLTTFFSCLCYFLFRRHNSILINRYKRSIWRSG